MRCPVCQVDNDKVVDSRGCEDSFAIRRRRQCVSCGHRYRTYERIEEFSIKVVKKNGVREPFSRDKIRNGLRNACWKRPLSDEQIDGLVTAVASDIHANFPDEIESREIGEMVMERLKGLDQVAYVRFASVYREFKDARDFVSALSVLNPPIGSPSKNGRGGEGSGDSEPHAAKRSTQPSLSERRGKVEGSLNVPATPEGRLSENGAKSRDTASDEDPSQKSKRRRKGS